MHKVLLTGLVLGCFVAGCRPKTDATNNGTSEVNAKLAAQEQRLAQLEAETQALKARLDAQAKPAVATNTPALMVQVESLVTAGLGAVVASEVARQVEGKLGTEKDVDTIFRQAVDEQMTAYDKRQREAREEERRKQREEWEKQRAEAEKRQWDQIRTDLALNENQTVQLKEVSQQARQTIRDTFRTLREQGTATPEEIRQQADAFKASYEASLRQVLTAEQLDAYRNQPRNLLHMIDMFAGGGHGARHFGDSTGP